MEPPLMVWLAHLKFQQHHFCFAQVAEIFATENDMDIFNIPVIAMSGTKPVPWFFAWQKAHKN